MVLPLWMENRGTNWVNLLVSYGKLMTEVGADLPINKLGATVHQTVLAGMEPKTLDLK